MNPTYDFDGYHSDPVPCPECRAGKHRNCNGRSWDFLLDEECMCPCAEAGHW